MAAQHSKPFFFQNKCLSEMCQVILWASLGARLCTDVVVMDFAAVVDGR